MDDSKTTKNTDRNRRRWTKIGIRNIYPYDPEKIHGTLLTRQEIETLLQDLKIKSLSERLDLKPLEPGREDLIIAGTAIVLKTMKMFECETLLVSEYSLREGITLKGLENKAYRDWLNLTS